MRKRYEVYKCEVCGNIVQVLHGGVGSMVCCNKTMRLLNEAIDESGSEKHVPVVESVEEGIKVKVGSVPHPMEENHYIEWIEIVTADGKRGKRFLKPGDKPQVEFYTRQEVVGARAFCNVHGVWKK